MLGWFGKLLLWYGCLCCVFGLFFLPKVLHRWLQKSVYSPYLVWDEVRFMENVVGVGWRMFRSTGIKSCWREGEFLRGWLLGWISMVLHSRSYVCAHIEIYCYVGRVYCWSIPYLVEKSNGETPLITGNFQTWIHHSFCCWIRKLCLFVVWIGMTWWSHAQSEHCGGEHKN